MRLIRHLNEKPEFPKSKSKEEVRDIILKDCKPFLKEIKGGELLWRGSDLMKDIKKKIPRTDRRPMDTDEVVHDYLDILFKKHHGWKARSEGVFVDPNRNSTAEYGKPSLFFPIGDFKYLWNQDVDDLTTELAHGLGFYKHQTSHLKDISVQENIDKLVKGYTNKRLKYASNLSIEIMFKCKSYYLVHQMYYDTLLDII